MGIFMRPAPTRVLRLKAARQSQGWMGSRYTITAALAITTVCARGAEPSVTEEYLQVAMCQSYVLGADCLVNKLACQRSCASLLLGAFLCWACYLGLATGRPEFTC